MSRYIDADALIGGIKENNLGEWYVGRIDGKSEEVIPTDTVYKIIDSAPSIDIVRCSECKYCVDAGAQRALVCDNEYIDMDIHPDDFCSYGEREGE